MADKNHNLHLIVIISVITGLIMLFGCGVGTTTDDGSKFPFSVRQLKITGKILYSDDMPLSIQYSYDNSSSLRGSLPLVGATVYLESNKDKYSTTTDPDGKFVLEGVPAGTHRIVAKYEPSGIKLYKNRSEAVTVSDSRSTAEIRDLTVLEAKSTLEGLLTDSKGTPIRNARMLIWGEPFYSDSNGKFITPPMPLGIETEIITDVPKYQETRIAAYFTEEVLPEEKTPYIEQTLVETGEPNRPPTVSLRASKYKVQPGQIVDLTAQAFDPDGNSLKYAWDWNVGALSTYTNELSAVWTAPNRDVDAKIKFTATEFSTDENFSAKATIYITVGDGGSGIGPQILSITPPVSEPLYENTTYQLFVLATDTVGGLTYTWKQPDKGVITAIDNATMSWRTPLLETGVNSLLAAVKVSVVNADAQVTEYIATYTILARKEPIDKDPEIVIIEPRDGSLHKRGEINFIAAAYDGNGEEIPAAGFVWYMVEHPEGPLGTPDFTLDSAKVIAFQKNSFKISLTEAATYAVKLDVVDAENASASKIMFFRVNSLPSAIITEPLNNSVFAKGEPIRFSGSALDTEDGVIKPDKLYWELDTYSEQGNTLTYSALPPGTHTIKLKAHDSLGDISQAEISIYINEGPKILSVSPQPDTIFARGEEVVLIADVTHKHIEIASESIKWTSKKDGLLGTGYIFKTSSLSLGNHLIGVDVLDTWGFSTNATTSVIITATATVSIEEPLNNQIFQLGELIEFKGIVGVDPENPFDIATISWKLGEDYTGFGQNISYSNLSPGTHTIRLVAKDSKGFESDPDIIKIYVNKGPTISQLLPASQPALIFMMGDRVDFSVVATHLDKILAVDNISWTSHLDGSIGNGSAFSIATLSPGRHTITVEVDDGWGGYATSNTEVIINTSSVVTIVEPLNRSIYQQGSLIPFRGVVSTQNSPFEIDRIVWKLGTVYERTGEQFTYADLPPGTHTIKLVAYDTENTPSDPYIIEIYVNPGPVINSVVPSPSPIKTFLRGAPVTFRVNYHHNDKPTIPDAQIKWESSIDGQIGSGQEISVSTLSLGEHSISVGVNDGWGGFAAANTALIVSASSTAKILSPSNNTIFQVGNNVELVGTATKELHDPVAIARLQWTLGGLQKTGERVTYTDLSPGTHSVSLIAYDAQEIPSVEDKIDIYVNPGPTIIQIGPASQPVKVFLSGEQVTFSSDVTHPHRSISDQNKTWESNLDGILGTGPSLSTKTLSIGNHVITFKVVDGWGGEASKKTAVIINSSAIANIVAPVNNEVSQLGASVNFVGVATVQPGNPFQVERLEWNLGGFIRLEGTEVSYSALPAGTHTITLIAYDENDTPSDPAAIKIFVNPPPVIGEVLPASQPIPIYMKGDPVNFITTVTHEFEVIKPSQVSWTSTKDGLLGNGTSLTITDLTPGHHTVTVNVNDSWGGTANKRTALIVNATSTALIKQPMDGTIYQLGNLVSFEGEAKSTPGDPFVIKKLVWRIENGAYSYIHEEEDGKTYSIFSKSDLPAGTSTVFLTAYDENDTPSDPFTLKIYINPGPKVSQVTPSSPPAKIFMWKTPVAISANVTHQHITIPDDKIVWTSSKDGLLGTGSSLSLSDLSLGTHQITLDVDDTLGTAISTTTQLIVNATPTVIINSPLDGSDYPYGYSVQFDATSTTEPGNPFGVVSYEWDLGGVYTRISSSFVYSGLPPGMHTITVVAKDSNGTESDPKSVEIYINDGPNITNLRPEPSSNYVAMLGQPVTLEATITHEDEVIHEANVTWSSSKSGVLGNGKRLTLSDLALGIHTITVKASDSWGGLSQATTQVTINATPTVDIIQPLNGAHFQIGETIQFEGTYSQLVGNPFAVSGVLWDISGVDTRTVLTFPYSTLTRGYHNITFKAMDSYGAESDPKTIRIYINDGPTITSIGRSPSQPVVMRGEQIIFSSVVTHVNEEVPPENITWSSSKNGVLGTGQTISVSNLSLGDHIILLKASDTWGGFSQATLQVTINATPTAIIIRPVTDSQYSKGELISFEASYSREPGDPFDVDTYSWELNGSYLSALQSFTTSSIPSGLNEISLKVRDSDGAWSAPKTVQIYINSGPKIDDLMRTPSDKVVLKGVPIEFSANITHPDEVIPDSQITWTSDKNGLLGHGSSITVQNLNIGKHSIVLKATDSYGALSQVLMSVEINATPTVIILQPENKATFVPGQLITFEAFATDEPGDEYPTNQYVWDLGGGINRVGIAATYSGFSPGSHTISVEAIDSVGARSAPAEVEIYVNAGPVISNLLPQKPHVKMEGEDVHFSATVTHQDETILDSNITWKSDKNGVLGYGRSVTKNNLNIGIHTITITASDTWKGVTQGTTEVIINATPTAIINNPAHNTFYQRNQMVNFNGTYSQHFDDPATSVTLRWYLGGVLQHTGPSFSSSTLPGGTCTVRLEATDNFGAKHSVTNEIYINDGPSISNLTRTPLGVRMKGEEITFSANIAHHYEIIPASDITWTSDKDGTLGKGSLIKTITLSPGEHVITLTASDTMGGIDTSTTRITINATSTAIILKPTETYFTKEQAISGILFEGTYTQEPDSPYGVTGYTWTLDGGRTKNGLSFTDYSLPWNPNGRHQISFVTKDANGAESDPASIEIFVNGGPIITNVLPAPTPIYMRGDLVSFSANVTHNHTAEIIPDDRVTWKTNQQAGNLSNGRSFAFSSLAPGTHLITITASDTWGRITTETTEVIINATATAKIDAPLNNAIFQLGDNITFDGSYILEPGDPFDVVSMDWDLGGLTALSGSSVSYALLPPGTHTISLTAVDSQGAKSDAVSIKVYVNPGPSINSIFPERPISNPYLRMLGSSIAFSTSVNHPRGDIPPANIVWDSDIMGIPIGSGYAFEIATLTVGTHKINLTVSDLWGGVANKSTYVRVNATPSVSIDDPIHNSSFQIAGPAIDFEGSYTNFPPESEPVILHWNIAGYTTTTTAVPHKLSRLPSAIGPGTHTVSLKAVDVFDAASDLATISIYINPGMTVTRMVPPQTPAYVTLLGNNVAFAVEASHPNESPQAARLTWDSDVDGTLGTGFTLNIPTLSLGTHTITLTASDSWGGLVSSTTTVLMNNYPVVTIDKPVASWTMANTTVELTGSGTAAVPISPALAISDFAWILDYKGAKTNLSGNNIGHMFGGDKLGTHTITVIGTDNYGYQSTATKEFFVNADPTITITTATGTRFNSDVIVAANPTHPAGAGFEVQWTSDRVPNTILAIGPAVTITGLASGPHKITAKVIDIYGRTASDMIEVLVNYMPVITDIVINSTEGSMGNYSDAGQNINIYKTSSAEASLTFSAETFDFEIGGDIAGFKPSLVRWYNADIDPTHLTATDGEGKVFTNTYEPGRHTVTLRVYDSIFDAYGPLYADRASATRKISFHVWRVNDAVISDALAASSAVHITGDGANIYLTLNSPSAQVRKITASNASINPIHNYNMAARGINAGANAAAVISNKMFAFGQNSTQSPTSTILEFRENAPATLIASQSTSLVGGPNMTSAAASPDKVFVSTGNAVIRFNPIDTPSSVEGTFSGFTNPRVRYRGNLFILDGTRIYGYDSNWANNLNITKSYGMLDMSANAKYILALANNKIYIMDRATGNDIMNFGSFPGAVSMYSSMGVLYIIEPDRLHVINSGLTNWLEN